MAASWYTITCVSEASSNTIKFVSIKAQIELYIFVCLCIYMYTCVYCMYVLDNGPARVNLLKIHLLYIGPLLCYRIVYNPKTLLSRTSTYFNLGTPGENMSWWHDDFSRLNIDWIPLRPLWINIYNLSCKAHFFPRKQKRHFTFYYPTTYNVACACLFSLQNSLNTSWHRFSKMLDAYLRKFGPHQHDSMTQLLHIHGANLQFHQEAIWVKSLCSRSFCASTLFTLN